jgi:uncharacterized protein (TIGR00255 family)
MTKSMTAFAQAEASNVSWEIRSVNQRYLDVTFRLPESMKVLETELRVLTKSFVSRGKIDCVLRLSDNQAAIKLTVDESLLQAIDGLQGIVAEKTNSKRSDNALELLRWPGVIKEPAPDLDSQFDAVRSIFSDAIEQLVAMRRTEGDALTQIIDEKLIVFGDMVKGIRQSQPKIIADHQQKLKTKLAELATEADPGRLEQELVLIANKSDIAEELDRLDTHINEVRNTLSQKGAIGRRLDFLMQELNREANTLSSKSLDTVTTFSAVDMKVLIEQMREQIQNIE